MQFTNQPKYKNENFFFVEHESIESIRKQAIVWRCIYDVYVLFDTLVNSIQYKDNVNNYINMNYWFINFVLMLLRYYIIYIHASTIFIFVLLLLV